MITEITHEDELLINGSGLFMFNSNVPEQKKLEIIKWYKSLDKTTKDYVKILRNEASSDAVFEY